MPSATDVIVLSSSPDRIPSQTPAQPKYDPERLFGLSPLSPSPPPLPSPSELFQAQAPTRSRFFQDEKSERPSSRKQKSSIVTKGNGSGASKRKAAAVGEKSRRTKEGQSKGNSQTALGDLEPPILKLNEGTSKKGTGTRKKRSDAGSKRTQSKSKTITGRVAKSGTTQTDVPGDMAKEPVASGTRSGKATARKADVLEKDDLQLEAAMKRRLDWTPAKDTSKQVVELNELDGANGQNCFSDLLSGYGFSKASPDIEGSAKHPEDGCPTKRRRIELLDSKIFSTSKQTSLDVDCEESTHDSARSSKAPAIEEKPKRKSKKITTLTGRVTARYVNDTMYCSDTANTITKAFGEVASTKAGRSTVQREGKSNSRSQNIDSFILPPEEAVSFLKEQDLMFGTYSQLEREDSPTMLRDMQTAIHASENNTTAEMKPSSTTRLSAKLSNGAAVSCFTAQRNLWSVAARDSDGLLAQIEVLDMVDISDISELPTKPDDSSKNATEQTDEDTGHDIVGQADLPSQEQSAENLNKDKGAVMESDGQLKEATSRKTAAPPRMPRYTDFTDSRLSKQVKAFGFKPMKSRKKMIELLEKCWESKHGSTRSENRGVPEDAHDSPQVEPNIAQSLAGKQPSEKITSPRTRKSNTKSKAKSKTSGAPEIKPNQVLSKSFADVEEIEDSEEELIPSPSRVQSRYARQTSETRGSQSLPVSTTPISPARTSSDLRARLSPSDTVAEPCLPDLASQISKAVRVQPRSFSAGCKRPSWHEKILMYDPIILEDFAIWLNTEGLGLVHEDREVSAGFVREWCESNGICCCFRKNNG